MDNFNVECINICLSCTEKNLIGLLSIIYNAFAQVVFFILKSKMMPVLVFFFISCIITFFCKEYVPQTEEMFDIVSDKTKTPRVSIFQLLSEFSPSDPTCLELYLTLFPTKFPKIPGENEVRSEFITKSGKLTKKR
ncbi:uncharacterized protein LOC119681857 [Teleopsis dalmanni]|uniref:uncharacterized protein LOC119673830 n=1 Tax=Teleopsis dalmanni TaxID=139649 RepID=UPI0018CF3A9C|nr:uncharacterized protein LOC119673830 [Teleopsis dalmanni]XP_037951076.1 uncharacterized protein LOC119681857 [Teleopsis dalmanni]